MKYLALSLILSLSFISFASHAGKKDKSSSNCSDYLSGNSDKKNVGSRFLEGQKRSDDRVADNNANSRHNSGETSTSAFTEAGNNQDKFGGF